MTFLSDVESAAAALLNPSQSFAAIPVVNTSLALYTLTIRAPGHAKAAVASYTFPISPSSLVKRNTVMTGIYDVAGSPAQIGVRRNVDVYGASPPTYMLEGTTGWQRHSSDGFGLTGMQSIAALQAMLTQYEELNQQQMANGNPDLYTLEFYDYFAGEYWRIEPVGEQTIAQESSKPLYFRYSFHWAAIYAVADPIQPSVADPILAALVTAPGAALAVLAASTGVTLAAYAVRTGGTLAAGFA